MINLSYREYIMRVYPTRAQCFALLWCAGPNACSRWQPVTSHPRLNYFLAQDLAHSSSAMGADAIIMTSASNHGEAIQPYVLQEWKMLWDCFLKPLEDHVPNLASLSAISPQCHSRRDIENYGYNVFRNMYTNWCEIMLHESAHTAYAAPDDSTGILQVKREKIRKIKLHADQNQRCAKTLLCRKTFSWRLLSVVIS
jgi:hypothetical protein